MLTKQEAKEFVRQLARETNRKLRDHQEEVNGRKKVKRPKKFRLRVYHPPDRVTFRFHKANYELGEYIYTEVVNGVECGRVKIGLGSDGEPKILMHWVIPRKDLFKNLNLTERIKVTKSENRWKGIKS